MNTSLRLATFLLLGSISAACAVAQTTLYVGPAFGYTISAASPDGLTFTSGPQRVNFGAMLLAETKRQVQFRAVLSYRSDQADFNQPAPQLKPVVTPGGGGGGGTSSDQIKSTIGVSSVELDASVHFPFVKIDSSGTMVTAGMGLFVDRTLSASQTDDYSGVTGWQANKTASEDFPATFGGGAFLDLGLSLPMGSSRMVFDLAYFFRSAPASADQYSWLMKNGLRIGVAYCF